MALIATLAGGVVLAQSSSSADLAWSLLDGGGEAQASANYQLYTSGGTLTGEIASSAGFQVVSGFHQGVYLAVPTPTPTPDPGKSVADGFEADDQCAAAKSIGTSGAAQSRNFHVEGDEDWVQFAAAEAGTYRVEIETPQNSSADVVVELYPDCDSPASTELSPTFSPGVRLDFAAPAAGTYYLRLLNCPGCASNSAAVYDLSVRSLAATTAVTGDAAIILAGRLKANDAVQSNIHFVTNEAYALFELAGYSGEQIMYLASDPSVPGYDQPATLATLQDAIVNWAAGAVGTNGMLTLYLMDHGDNEIFYVDEVTGQRLTPGDLHGWLTALESSRPDRVRVNVFIEACNSGSFIDIAGGSISKIGRVVVASTNAQTVAYASQDGAHFSDQFVGALRQGRHILSSFAQAQTSVLQTLPLQTPWLDDNGDGVPNSNDGVLASQRSYIYNTNLNETATLYPPAVFTATLEPAAIGSRYTILADVRDDKGVQRVWAAIYPPSYRPPDDSTELVPETVPTVELTVQGGLYTGTYDFDETGDYRVVIHALDGDRLGAAPKSLTLATGALLYLPRIQR